MGFDIHGPGLNRLQAFPLIGLDPGGRDLFDRCGFTQKRQQVLV